MVKRDSGRDGKKNQTHNRCRAKGSDVTRRRMEIIPVTNNRGTDDGLGGSGRSDLFREGLGLQRGQIARIRYELSTSL